MIKKFYLKLLMSLMLVALAVPQVMAEPLTVADGSATSEYVPIYGFYYDTGFKNTMVYPADLLSEMAGGTINSITFYANSDYTALSGGTVKVSLKEVDGTTVNGHFSDLTQVFSGTPTKDGNKCVITFDTPFEYQGGNLAVEIHLTSTGSNCPTINFLGVNQTGASYNSYGGTLANSYVRNILPKATFDYDSGVLADYSAKVNPTEIAFGKLAVDGIKTVNVTLKNNGLNAFSYSLSGLVVPFSTTATNGSLESQASVEIPVKFNPTTEGDFTGTLTINCGEAGSFTVTLTGSAANEITVCEASNEMGTLPVYGLQHDNDQTNQMLYPAEKLTGMIGKTITSMTFYPSAGISFYNGSVTFALANMPAGTSTYPTFRPELLTPSEYTTVGTIDMPSSRQDNVTEWGLSFTTPFVYNGGDLLIIVTTEHGNWGSTSFKAENQGSVYRGIYSYGSTKSSVSYLPMVTFGFGESTPTPVISGTVTPTTLDFGTVTVGEDGTATITVANTGNTAFTPIFSILEAPFSIAEATEIAAGQSKEFAVTYAPEEIGSHTGTLNVTIGEQTPIAVTLTGAATEAPLEITVAENGTAQSQPIPIEGTYLDTEGAYSQTIYNKDDIRVLAGNNISKIKYYSATTFDAAKIGGTVLEIYLMETENDEMPIPEGAYSAQPLTFDGVSIGEYEIQGGETEMEFVLNTPFNYSGAKNLAIQVRVKTKSPQTSGYNYQPINWYGEGKTISISYAGNVGSYNNGAKSFLPKTTFTYEKEEEPAAVEATLAQIEGAEGVVGTKYAITDEYLVAVENRDVDVDGTGYVYVWCKDNDNVTDRLAAADGVIDFMQQQGVQGDWDQSNWVVLRFKGDDQEARSLKNCKLTNVIGTYVDASNYMIDVESYEKGESAEYTPNVYCVANFNAANWGTAGVQQEGKDSDAPYYFFMTPKAQEVCKVTFAEWNGTAFTVPAASGFAQNTLTLGWTYNQNSDGTPMSQEAVVANLDEGTSYQFNAIVTRSSSKGAISGGSVIYPTNLVGGEDDEVPTAISTVSVNGMVESVKYYNVAGVESNEPFEGVNIVVTRYSDGSTTTTKVLK